MSIIVTSNTEITGRDDYLIDPSAAGAARSQASVFNIDGHVNEKEGE